MGAHILIILKALAAEALACKISMLTQMRSVLAN